MKRTLAAWLVVVLAGVLCVSTAIADLAPPPPPDKPEMITEFSVLIEVAYQDLDRAEPGLKAKLMLPEGAFPGAAPEAVPMTSPPSAPFGFSPSGFGTVMAGIALTLAIASAGLLMRGNRRLRTASAALLGLALVLGGYSMAVADIPPFSRPRPAPPHLVIQVLKDLKQAKLIIDK